VSGFWDAIGRAALGLPGTAEPRPRSIYEPDAVSSPGEETEPLDLEADGGWTAPPIDPPAGPPPPPPAPADARRSEERTMPDLLAEEAVDGEEELSDRSSVEARSIHPPEADIESAEKPPELPGIQMAPAVERIEVTRVETARVVTQSTLLTRESHPSPPAENAALPPGLVDAETEEREQASEERYEDLPLAVVAEPQVAEPEPLPLPALAQEPPLVIEIDRIDIRIEPEQVVLPAPKPRREAPAVPSLADYLARRSEASR
jgi:hypothetical protein